MLTIDDDTAPAIEVLESGTDYTGLAAGELAWFVLGSFHGHTGDLNRFFAGDPTAGKFMAGFFPVMMFGLPAACLAMYHTALPDTAFWRRSSTGRAAASTSGYGTS